MDGTAPTRRAPFGANPLVGERGTETERRIYLAALEVFAEVGFNEARVELITKRAGCSRPAFYQYFSSKDDVFWRLGGALGVAMNELGATLAPIGPDDAGVATLAAWIDEFYVLYEAYAPIFSQFQAASRDHGERAQQSSSFSARLDTALLRAFGRPNRGKDQALASATAAILIRCGHYWGAVAAAGPDDRDRLVVGLARFNHRLFHGPIQGVNIERARPAGSGPRPATAVMPPLPESAHARPLRPRGEQTRRRLLDAGAQVMPARGYHVARGDYIVAAAGVSHGSFYRYFADKDDFFHALAQQAGDQLMELLSRFPADGDPTDLQAWVEEWFDSYESNGGVITTWQELQEAGTDLVEFSLQVAGSIVTGLMEMFETRDFGDALVDSLILLAVLERLPYRTFTLGYTSRNAAVAATVTIVRQGLLGEPA